jgi:transcriptional regulator with XRE-family HTH domain
MELKDWRTANCYSQAAFARLLKEKAGVEINRTTVWCWENGHQPRDAALQAIKKVTRGQVKPSSFTRKPKVTPDSLLD